MKFIVKLFPEITIKSKSVRRRFSKMLQGNIRNVLRRFDETVTVRLEWDLIHVRSQNDSPENRQKLIEALSCTPGIAHFLEVQQTEYKDLHDIYEQTLELWKERLTDKTFCVRVKRRGKHDFTSLEAERYIGGGLNQNAQTAGVKLSKPDVEVTLEIDQDQLFLIKDRHQGPGGFPIATQEDVLSLISGGYDSGVSSHQFIARGSRTHYCFFNLGGAAHETGVKQVSYHLWDRFGSSHKVKFFTVPFEGVVAEILEKVENSQMGVILKRMMMRAADRIAQQFEINALVTGEAMGQVSSQTLTNLSMIDRVSDTLILRPLIAMDKQSIIDKAREIGTADFAEVMPEYCGVISQKPTVKAVEEKLLEEESKFDFSVLDKAIEDTRYIDIKQIAKESKENINEVEQVELIAQDEIILDIRSPEEEEEQPLELENHQVIHLPFYKLASSFGDLDQSKTYLLYCDRGVMSRLQALYLKDNGFNNVKLWSNK